MRRFFLSFFFLFQPSARRKSFFGYAMRSLSSPRGQRYSIPLDRHLFAAFAVGENKKKEEEITPTEYVGKGDIAQSVAVLYIEKTRLNSGRVQVYILVDFHQRRHKKKSKIEQKKIGTCCCTLNNFREIEEEMSIYLSADDYILLYIQASSSSLFLFFIFVKPALNVFRINVQLIITL